MLYFTLLSLLAATSNALLSSYHPLVGRQLGEEPCAVNCSVPFTLLLSCAQDPDLSCGCTEFIAAAPACAQCLSTTNTTLAGFFDAATVAITVATCQCIGLPSCQSIVASGNKCIAESNSDPTCQCASIAANGTDCNTCLESKDPTVGVIYAQFTAGCQAYENSTSTNSTSASSSAVSSGSASSQPSIVSPSQPIFTGGAVANSVGRLLSISLFGILYLI